MSADITPLLGRERDEFTHCPSHSGAGIEAALAHEVGTRFAIEKPRAKDFWVGAIGAATRPQRKETGRGKSSLEQNIEVECFPVFPLLYYRQIHGFPRFGSRPRLIFHRLDHLIDAYAHADC